MMTYICHRGRDDPIRPHLLQREVEEIRYERHVPPLGKSINGNKPSHSPSNTTIQNLRASPQCHLLAGNP